MSIFGEKVREEAVETLIPALDHLLSKVGFKQTERGEWERDSTWRVDEVDLRLRDVTRYGLQPAFRVAIPRSDVSQAGDTYRYLAESKLPRILHASAAVDASIPLPKLGLQIRRFVEGFVTDINAALPWFEQFATPEACKANLAKFIKPGCPAYIDAEKLLASLTHR